MRIFVLYSADMASSFFSTSCTRPGGFMQLAYSFHITASVFMFAYNFKAHLIIRVDLDQNPIPGCHLPVLMYELTLGKPLVLLILLIDSIADSLRRCTSYHIQSWNSYSKASCTVEDQDFSWVGQRGSYGTAIRIVKGDMGMQQRHGEMRCDSQRSAANSTRVEIFLQYAQTTTQALYRVVSSFLIILNHR